MANLFVLKQLVFESNNDACFIERERILSRLEKEMTEYTADDKYAIILSKLLSEVSTPIFDCDYFAGRVLEAFPDENLSAPNRLLNSLGHMSFDYQKILTVGLKGVLEEIQNNAAQKGDNASLRFAHNAEIVVNAIKDYCGRYSKAAKQEGFKQMAEALSKVPFEPAYDFIRHCSRFGLFI